MPAQSKIDMLEKVNGSLKSAKGLFVVDYRGLSVKESQEVRRALREAGAEMKVYKLLEEWADKIRTIQTQLGSFKADYATIATFRIFKQDGTVAAEYTIHGCWPKQVPDLQFNGAAQAVPVQIEWSFDYAERV